MRQNLIVIFTPLAKKGRTQGIPQTAQRSCQWHNDSGGLSMINLQKYSTNKLSKFPGFVAFLTLQKVMGCTKNAHVKCLTHVSRVPHIFARLHCWISKASSIEDILGLDYACRKLGVRP